MNSYYEGFIKSKGKYIFFLDSDDYFKINKIKKVVNAFDKYFSNVVFDLPILKLKINLSIIVLYKKNLYFLTYHDLHLKVVLLLKKICKKNF